jgi:hypothetical protein
MTDSRFTRGTFIFKGDVCGIKPGRKWDDPRGEGDPHALPTGPIVMFHGPPKPHEVPEIEWVREHWVV